VRVGTRPNLRPVPHASADEDITDYFRWGRKKVASKSKHAFEIKVAGIQCDLRDVSYHVRRKKGFPSSMSNSGTSPPLPTGAGLSY